MKKQILNFVLLIAVSMTFTSCYNYTSIVGKGPQGNQQVKKWNNYILFGLVPVGVSDSKQMADGASDYSVLVSHSFITGLIGGLTFGIYTPTTTTVTK